MNALSEEDREAFWRDLMACFEGRLVGWLRRTPLPERDYETLVGEVWALAVEREAELRRVDDPWPTLQSLMRSAWAEWRPIIDRELVEADGGELRSTLLRLASVASEESVSEERERENEGESEGAIRRLVFEALAKLSKREREVMTLRFFGGGERGLEYPVIADRLGISESTVRQNVMRARGHLFKILEGRGLSWGKINNCVEEDVNRNCL